MGVTRIFSALLLLLLTSTQPVIAQESEGADLQVVQQSIKQTELQLQQQRKQIATVQSELRKGELAISNIASEVYKTKTNVTQKQQQKNALQAEQHQLKLQINAQKTSLKSELKVAHGNGASEAFKVLLNQQDASEIQRNLTYFKHLMQARTFKIESFRASISKLEQVTLSLNKNIVELQALEDKLVKQQKTLKAQQAEKETVVQRFNQLVNTNEQKLQALKQSEAELQEKLASIELEAIRTIELNGLSGVKGQLTPPAQGRLRKLFGIIREGQVRWNGIKIEANSGTPVNAVYQGQVLFSDWIKGFGLVMVVDHGEGYMSIYGHNQALLKQAGDQVLAGERIALMGSSGGQRKSALYFEIRFEGTPVNPTRWFK